MDVNHVIREIRQRQIRYFMDEAPSDNEIKKAVLHAKQNKASGDTGIAAEFWQALETRPSTSELLHEYITDCWLSCTCSSDWLESRLKILYKGKGDSRDLNNWRGIMLIETFAAFWEIESKSFSTSQVWKSRTVLLLVEGDGIGYSRSK